MSDTLLLVMVAVILLRGLSCRDAYGAFLRGAERGMRSAAAMLPSLCGMLLMLGMLRSSGLTDLLVRLAAPVMGCMGVPQETIPLLLLRPLTGSGSLAALEEIFALCGPDSRAGRLASVLMGSSETIFYTLSIYVGASGAKRLPGAVAASMAGYAAAAAVGILLVR